MRFGCYTCKLEERASKHYANAEKFEHQSTYAMSYRTMLLLLYLVHYKRDIQLCRIDTNIQILCYIRINKQHIYIDNSLEISSFGIKYKKKKKNYCQIPVSRTIDTEIIDAMYCHLYGKTLTIYLSRIRVSFDSRKLLNFRSCVSRMKVPCVRRNVAKIRHFSLLPNWLQHIAPIISRFVSSDDLFIFFQHAIYFLCSPKKDIKWIYIDQTTRSRNQLTMLYPSIREHSIDSTFYCT